MFRRLLAIIYFFGIFPIFSQDIHYSQFWNLGNQLNPGMTGVMDGDLRAGVLYRNQWSTIVPYNTYGVNLDTKFETNGNVDMGLGINVHQDQSGDAKFGNTSAYISFSSILKFNDNNHVSLGLAGGIYQKGFDPSSAKWNSQYQNGAFNSSAVSGEEFSQIDQIKGDLSAGLVYRYKSDNRVNISRNKYDLIVGFSYNHILRPNFRWYTQFVDQLYSNLIAHAELIMEIPNSRISFKPSIFAQFQGPSNELLFGGQILYNIVEPSNITGFVKGASLNIGVFVRNADAIIPSLSFQFHNFLLGLSYDFNISKLRAVTNGNGAFEICLLFRNPNSFLWQGRNMRSMRRSRFK